jgi:hypothetical protein
MIMKDPIDVRFLVSKGAEAPTKAGNPDNPHWEIGANCQVSEYISRQLRLGVTKRQQHADKRNGAGHHLSIWSERGRRYL